MPVGTGKNKPNANSLFVMSKLQFLNNRNIDIALCVSDPRLKNNGWGGVLEFAKTFNPRLLIPMHMKGNYKPVNELAKQLQQQPTQRLFWPVSSELESIFFSK